MTWTLFDTLGSGGNVHTGRVINDFEGDVVYVSTLSVDLWQYVVGGSDTKICDASDELIQQDSGPFPALLGGTDLFIIGAGGATIVRKVMSYDGTPESWTLLATLNTLADTSGDTNVRMAPNADRDVLIASLGVIAADGGDEEVADSTDGVTWNLIPPMGIRSIAGPITIATGDTYSMIRNGSSQYQFAAYNAGSWDLDASTYALVTYQEVNHWWIDQEFVGAGFSGLWLRRSADSVMLRSVDGGSSFAVTQTDAAADFTAPQTDVFSLRGLEFMRSTIGGTNRLWYFDNNATEWVLVDTTVLPQTAIDGMFVRGTTLYLMQGDDVYTTDEFLFPSPPATDAEWTAAPMTKPASIDADGTYIYIAALNSLGFPTLIQFPTALNADGTIVYDPGAGTDIGVQCSPTNPAVIWAAGELGGTDTVVRSDDGATTFPVVDPGTFDPVLSFAAGPDDDERCIVATETPGGGSTASLFETLDAGGAWATRITGLASPSRILAIARLQVNPDEIVIGNGVDVSNRSDYSPNAGANLEDLTTGTFFADGTGVIVG